jgi:hypothetical protein
MCEKKNPRISAPKKKVNRRRMKECAYSRGSHLYSSLSFNKVLERQRTRLANHITVMKRMFSA